MHAIAYGWQGAALNLSLILGMLYSPWQVVERILFAVFVLLSALTVRAIVMRARNRSPRPR